MNLPPRQKLLALVAAAAVGLLLLDYLVIEPLVGNWQQRSAAIDKLKKDIAAGETSLNRADYTRADWADMQKNSLPLNTTMAEQELLSAFDQWGRSSGIEVSSLKPQWKRGTNTAYSLLECRVDAVGPMSTVARFLYEMERSPIALKVESLELSARDAQGDKLSLSLVVSGLRLAPLEGKP